METVLALFKVDLGITHTLRDVYFNSLLLSCKGEIEKKGIILDLTNVEDQMLICDFALWRYRNRTEDIGLSKNLTFRIRNRVMKVRSEYVEA